MYHRYQPGENGQFRRRSFPDSKPSPLKPTSPPQPPPLHTTHDTGHAHDFTPHKEDASCHGETEQMPPPRFQLPFLEKLLPNIDNGDLLLLLIMLLLLSEGNEESSSVVMTLAIFLFLQ